MKAFMALNILIVLGLTLLSREPTATADSPDKLSPKEALQALNDFIGTWKGNGGPDKPRPVPKDTWSETLDWTWRFKGDNVWLNLAIKSGKHFQSAELRFLPDKQKYQLTATGKDGKKAVFEGRLKDEILIFERDDATKKETQRIVMNLAGDGARFIYRHEHKGAGKTLFVRDFQVACNKEGESLGVREKKIECVVSGGLGKIAVSFKGVTYYVCCSGCKDAFEENPEKYIKEYEAKKAGKK
jgi:hypothetical protein